MTVLIPLRRRDGSIRAHALVSDEDAYLTKYRWRMIGWGHVARNDYTSYTRSTATCVRLARQILDLSVGDHREADHINGDTLDNRRENLRIVTRGQNAQNISSHKDARSHYRGVDWYGPNQRWRVRVQIAGKVHYVGYYANEHEAGAAAADYRKRNMPFAVETSERYGLAERPGTS